jgi:transposase-like protein
MFLCDDCRHKFTVRTGTLWERSHVTLHNWLFATHLMAASHVRTFLVANVDAKVSAA